MATATRKKTSARTAAPKRPAPLVDLTEDAFDPETVSKTFLFELNGVEYFIPDAAPAGVLYEVVRLQEEVGQGTAMWWLLEQFLGEDGVKALRAYKGLTKTHLSKLYKACSDVLTGPKA